MSSLNPSVNRSASEARARPAIHAEDDGKLLLRLTIGILILLHGIAKLRGGLGPVTDLLTQHGLPAGVAYLVYVGEVLAPLLVIIGLWTRPAAFVIAINMLTALALAQAHQITMLNQHGGWAIELEGVYLFGALAIALLGAGRLSAGGSSGRFN